MTNDIEQVRRGEQARQILDSPLWVEAWELYRGKLLRMIEDADSNEADLVMHVKRLLTAATNARRHLEAVIVDGKISAKDIELQKERNKWLKI